MESENNEHLESFQTPSLFKQFICVIHWFESVYVDSFMLTLHHKKHFSFCC